MNIDLGGNTLVDGYFAGILAGPGVGTNIVFVDKTGSDVTGTVGNPSLPFLTAQQAYNALYNAYTANPTASYLVKFGVGSWSGIVFNEENSPNSQILFAGAGAQVSHLGGLIGQGTDGVDGATGAHQVGNTEPNYGNGGTGTNGADVYAYVYSDKSLNFGVISITSGAGGTGGMGGSQGPGPDNIYDNLGGTGGQGGLAGDCYVEIHNIIANSVSVTGGVLGYGGYGGTSPGGDGGRGGNGCAEPNTITINVYDSDVSGANLQVYGTSCNVNAGPDTGGGAGMSTGDLSSSVTTGIISLRRSLYTGTSFSGPDSTTVNDYGINGMPGASPSSSPPSSNYLYAGF